MVMLLLSAPLNAWVGPFSTCKLSTKNMRRTFHILASSDDSPDQNINGEASTTGGLVSVTDSKTQLFSAFAALDLNDQYDAVLTGLCANKILDDSNVRASDARTSLQDPLQLLDEMNKKGIRASPRSLMAIIDVSCRVMPFLTC